MLIQEIERSRVLLFNWIFTMSSEFGAFPERWHRDLAERLVHGSPQKAAEARRMHVRFRQADVIRKFQALAESGPGEQRMIRGAQRRNRRGDRFQRAALIWDLLAQRQGSGVLNRSHGYV